MNTRVVAIPKLSAIPCLIVLYKNAFEILFVMILIINKYGNILTKTQQNGQRINIIQTFKDERCSSFFLAILYALCSN